MRRSKKANVGQAPGYRSGLIVPMVLAVLLASIAGCVTINLPPGPGPLKEEVLSGTGADKILLVDEALERLKAEDPETAQVVVLKFFGGLTNEEIVAITGTSDRTVRRQWNYAKAWLFNCIKKNL